VMDIMTRTTREKQGNNAVTFISRERSHGGLGGTKMCRHLVFILKYEPIM
jgi:hypothetical protein